MSPRLAFAIETALAAGKATLAHFQVPTKVEIKPDQSPVTVADREAESLIRRAISESFPGEGVLGEEEGESGGDGRWVIDPIDGTKSFVAGVPLYATLLSFERDSEVEIGVCYFPALNELLYAEKTKGAFWNGRQCRVSNRPGLEGGIIATGSAASLAREKRLAGVQRIEKKVMASRTWSDAYGHALVATGRVEAMIDPIISHWDISAVSLIVREAGGKFTDLSGNEALANEALSSNGLVHAELVEAFQE
jgi:histidinol phosphatase-like enzyme (inositol monophosphatase family)